MLEKTAKQLLSNNEGNIAALLDDPAWSASHNDYKPPVYIPKRSGGRRKIMEPKPYLKSAQRQLVHQLSFRGYGASPFAHGFVNDRGRRTNALPHIGHTRMLKVDIENFFGVCTPEMVVEALENLEPPPWLVGLITRLCFLDNGLPQGSPASPMLSNIVSRTMDYRLDGLCKKFRVKDREHSETITYTRYADDLTFTSAWIGLKQLVHPVEHILGDCGFAVKHRKTKYFTAPTRLETCGVVVSENKINAKRRDRLYWRGRRHKMVTDIKHNGVPPGQFIHKDGRLDTINKRMLRKIQGKLAALVDVSRQDKASLFSKFRELRSLCPKNSTG